MPLVAQRFVRKMRGGAQAHLLQASDGHFYVVKFRNNPQHRRILVNEWIAAVLLKYLQLSAPPVALISLTSDFLQAHPDLCMQFGNRRELPEEGWHFGSRFPGDPTTLAVYDFLPDALLQKVENRTDFMGILAFDKWTANADSRQSVFFRSRLKEWIHTAQHPLRVGFVTLMVDHGYLFNGPHWQFADVPLQGLYFRPQVYAEVRGWDDFQPWLDRIAAIPEQVFDDALRQIPLTWVEDDSVALEQLLESLFARRKAVADRIADVRRHRPSVFPRWTA